MAALFPRQHWLCEINGAHLEDVTGPDGVTKKHIMFHGMWWIPGVTQLDSSGGYRRYTGPMEQGNLWEWEAPQEHVKAFLLSVGMTCRHDLYRHFNTPYVINLYVECSTCRDDVHECAVKAYSDCQDPSHYACKTCSVLRCPQCSADAIPPSPLGVWAHLPEEFFLRESTVVNVDSGEEIPLLDLTASLIDLTES
jgi:hypothetical protein